MLASQVLIRKARLGVSRDSVFQNRRKKKKKNLNHTHKTYQSPPVAALQQERTGRAEGRRNL